MERTLLHSLLMSTCGINLRVHAICYAWQSQQLSIGHIHVS